ncbi:MAG: 4Fe-4S binding protein, partial [Nitrospiraceae bacterium]|nr:4Fe-4S binding protein [Nitrospiraceae bacterium]
MTKGIQPWRRLVEVFEGAVILGLPFLRINGQSDLRFDVPSLRLYFFGAAIWMDEFFIVLVAIIFLVLLFVFVTLMVGRLWCGWVCPQTVLIDYTGFFDKVKKRERERGHLAGAASYVAVL